MRLTAASGLFLAAVLAIPAAAQAPVAPNQPATARSRWEGLTRRNPGLVLFKSRWDGGVLELKDDLLRWTDRRDPGKNLVLPVRRLLRHELRCPGAETGCTEWRVATRTETYVFREAEPGGGAALVAVFRALRAAYPDLAARGER